MTIQTPGKPANLRRAAIYPETTAIGVEEAGYAAGKQGMNLTELETGGLVTSSIGNDAISLSSFAGERDGVGKDAQEAAMTIGGPFSGALTASGAPPAASSDVVVENPVGWVMGAMCGAAPTIKAGSAIEAAPTPTTTQFTATTANLTKGQLCSVNIGGRIYTRVVIDVTGSEYTVAPPLPSAPTPGTDFVSPTIQVQLQEAIEMLLQGEVVGPDQTGDFLDVRFRGAVVDTFSFAERTVFDDPRWSAGLRVAWFERNVVAAPTPYNPITPYAAAGGEVYFWKLSDIGTPIILRLLLVSFEVNRSVDPDPDLPNEQLAVGGWLNGDASFTASIHVHGSQALPTATNTAFDAGVDTWREAFLAGRHNGEYGVLLALSNKYAGRGVNWHMPNVAVNVDPREATAGNNISAIRIELRSIDGLGTYDSHLYGSLN